ncbi:Methyltransferase-like protein 25 [Armadillidium nasatum]|uniref:Methyltransferase-like protein 25 n=1 Tax=Armadillidium nasatum TaxID=96803 RepID=A0A5N5TA13_9CRUS|nr:Methyltransferase-like protein 25 [Armadillidium nasatum]
MRGIFSLNVLERLPNEWKKWFDEDNNCHLDLLSSSMLCKDISYSSLKSFIKRCEEYSLSSVLKSRLKSLSFEVVEETLTSLQKEKGKGNSSSSSSIQNQISDAEINFSVGKVCVENPWKRIRQANGKKKHEVEELSSFMKKMKHFTKTDQIFDIGSGLGYLGLYLHLVHGYKVIGAEGSLSNVNASLKLQNNCLRTTCPAVKFIHWNLDDDGKTIEQAKLVTKNDLLSCTCSCGYDINSVMDVKNSPTSSYDIVSLHSCADLSPIMLKIFSNNENLSSLVSLSCCYHKMLPCVEEEELLATMKTNSKFKNFPLSRNLYDILEKREFKMNTFSLRLAAEESLCQYHNRTKTRNKLTEDVISIAFRAILQTVCEQNGLQMKKRRRHCGKKSSYSTFEEYISIIFEDYLFLTSSNDSFSNLKYLTSQLLQFYLKVKESLKYIALIRTLQLHLQPVLEGLILLDRVLYLKENGFNYSGIFELFDDAISPRNKAIFAFREKFLNL